MLSDNYLFILFGLKNMNYLINWIGNAGILNYVALLEYVALLLLNLLYKKNQSDKRVIINI